MGAIKVAAVTGAVAGFVATGTLKGAAIGALSGAAFAGIGNAFANTKGMAANNGWVQSSHKAIGESAAVLTKTGKAVKTVAHGMVGGLRSMASGGKFDQGFLSASFTQAVGGSTDNLETAGERIAMSGIVGGSASALAGGSFGDGAITGVFSRTFNDELHFDGKTLTWVDTNGKVFGSWGGVSGREGYQDPRFQNQFGKGPIPEGEYSFGEHQMWGELPFGEQLESTYSFGLGGEWPGGTYAWGKDRIWLQPNAGTDTLGRSGFSIHGGAKPGSAGCIDLTTNMNSFAAHYRAFGDRVDRLVVDY